MISLLITCFLSFFCCSCVPFDTLDHTNEIEYREDKNINELININDVVYIEGAMNLSLLNAWQDYSVILFGAENTFATGYLSNVPIGANATYTYNVTSDDSIGYIVDITYFINNGWTGWTDANVIPISSIVFYIERNNTYFNLYQITINLNRPSIPSQYNTRTYFFREYYNGSIQVGAFNNGLEISLGDNGNINLYAEGFVYSRYSSFYNSYGSGNREYLNGFNVGYNEGYASGYQHGFDDSGSYDPVTLTIFTGILEVGLLPVNVFLQILNFEVFGINIGGLVTSLLTVAIVIIIIRFLTGQKDD